MEQENLKSFKLLNDIKEKLGRIKLGNRNVDLTIQWLWEKGLCKDFEDLEIKTSKEEKRNKLILKKIWSLKENDEYKFNQWILLVEKELNKERNVEAIEEKNSWTVMQRNLDLDNIYILKSAPNLQKIEIVRDVVKSAISWITESIRELYKVNAQILVEIIEKLNYKEEVEFLKKELEGKMPKNLILEEEIEDNQEERKKKKRKF